MKKVLFYIALVGLAILIWLALGSILVLCFNGANKFSYALGSWCGQPYVILLAVGIALLFRTTLCRVILKEAKQYKQKAALYIIGAAILWGG